jgi:hypothetical protein
MILSVRDPRVHGSLSGRTAPITRSRSALRCAKSQVDYHSTTNTSLRASVWPSTRLRQDQFHLDATGSDALPAPTAKIGPGYSGNWDDPTPGKDGHGSFEILPNNGILAIGSSSHLTGPADLALLTRFVRSTSDTVTASVPVVRSSSARLQRE